MNRQLGGNEEVARQHLVDNNLDDAVPGNTSDKSTFSQILKP